MDDLIKPQLEVPREETWHWNLDDRPHDALLHHAYPHEGHDHADNEGPCAQSLLSNGS